MPFRSSKGWWRSRKSEFRALQELERDAKVTRKWIACPSRDMKSSEGHKNTLTTKNIKDLKQKPGSK